MRTFDQIQRINDLRDLDIKTEYGKYASSFINEYMDLNIFGLDLDTIVYRIISYERLIKSLKTRKFSMVRPSKWDDPFENFLLNATGVFPDGRQISLSEIRDSYYAQCWTTVEECDGLWRNFRGKSIAIRIKSSIRKIMNAFYDIKNVYHSSSYFIGHVSYFSEREIIDFFSKDIKISDFSGQALLFEQTLFIKRKQFSYENEVRLTFKKPNDKKMDLSLIKNKWDDSDIFEYSIDPNEIIEDILIEPLIDVVEYEKLKREIYSYGYTGLVSKSTLYEKPLLFIHME